MTYGYHGRYLQLDLSTGAAEWHPLAESMARRSIGGSGLATYLLYRHSRPGVEPLSPENTVVFASCPFVGTPITTTAKMAVAARSPQTGFLGDSLLSSHFAIRFKRAGLDALVLSGGAPRLSVLVLDNGECRLEDAAGLAGLGTRATEAAVRARLGSEFQVAAVGPAAEHGVRYASLSHDGRHAGRTGVGAALAAKNVKAVAVRGTHRTLVADAGGLKELADGLRRASLGPETEKYRVLGTAGNLLTFDRLGALPTRNFQQATFEEAERISGEALYAARERNGGCANCAITCEQLYRSSEAGGQRLEYESLFALGPMLGVGDPDVILHLTSLCDDLGMDTISTGGTLAWAMECYERGLLTREDLGGLELRFGAADAALALVPQIARREGVGALLAEGSRLAAARLGHGSDAWAMHVKGLELPGYEPRGLKTLALGLAVSSRGACHNRSSAYDADFSGTVDRTRAERERGQLAADSEDRAAVIDSLILCKFLRRCFTDFYPEAARLLSLVTGWDVDGDELRATGSRITDLKKAYNLREGWTRADDTLPPRLLGEALADGATAGVTLPRAELDMMVAAYYEARGWNPDGTLPVSTLEELDCPVSHQLLQEQKKSREG